MKDSNDSDGTDERTQAKVEPREIPRLWEKMVNLSFWHLGEIKSPSIDKG